MSSRLMHYIPVFITRSTHFLAISAGECSELKLEIAEGIDDTMSGTNEDMVIGERANRKEDASMHTSAQQSGTEDENMDMHATIEQPGMGGISANREGATSDAGQTGGHFITNFETSSSTNEDFLLLKTI